MSNLSFSFLNQLISERPSLASSKDKLKNFLLDTSILDEVCECPFSYFFNGGFRKYPNPRVSKYPISVGLGLASKSQSSNTVYISSEQTVNGSYKYRVEFQSQASDKSLIIHQDTPLNEAIKLIFSSDKLIFNRPEPNDRSRYFLDIARALGIEIILDFDDLILPEFTELTGYSRSRTGQNIEQNRFIGSQRSALLLYASKLQVSTSNLSHELAHLGKEILISPNKLPVSSFTPISDIVKRYSSINRRPVNFLYMSGTHTHAMDFSILLPSLIKIAQEYRDLFSLTIFGRTSSAFRCLSMYTPNIRYIGRVPFDQMLANISKFDVCLVPLENTLFNRCKSNIKFIESASQGVPTIASNLPEFSNHIHDSVNGWISISDNDWYSIIKNIIDNPGQIEKCGLLAYQTALDSFSIS